MTTPAPYFFVFVETRLGKAAIVWSVSGQDVRIVRICLPASEEIVMRELRRMFPAAAVKSCGVVAALAGQLQAFMEGKPFSFDTNALDMSRLPSYHRKVLAALAGIPRGNVMSYGGVAAKTGSPGGARAAGQGCGKNPFPLVYPCHRVIRADGSLGGFGGGLRLKRSLLDMEGVRFDAKGKVLPEYILR
jgi:methylated-DNA-[protein]-cysteine S-methyltransferase